MKCGSTKPSDDPAVGLDVVAVHEDRLAVDARSGQRQPVGIECRVIDDPAAAVRDGADYRPDLSTVCRPVRAGADHDGDVGRRDVASSRRIHGRSRSLGSGRVMSAMTIATRSRAARPRASGRDNKRRPHGLQERRFLAWQSGHVSRRENGHAFLGNRDVHALGAVPGRHAHPGTVPSAVSRWPPSDRSLTRFKHLFYTSV